MLFLIKNLRFLILFILILFLSCPNEIVKYSIWKGKYTFGANKKYNIELIFDSSSRVTGVFEQPTIIGNYISIQTDFTLTENYSFKAKFEKMLNLDGSPFGEKNDLIKIDIKGTLDYFSNKGNGTYDEELRINMTPMITDYEGDWELRKLVD